MAFTVPLKLGRMRASYPDVLPMSLSRKSEGDSCGPALLAGFISSLQELSLTLSRKKKEKQEQGFEHRDGRVRQSMKCSGCGDGENQIKQNENSYEQISHRQKKKKMQKDGK